MEMSFTTVITDITGMSCQRRNGDMPVDYSGQAATTDDVVFSMQSVPRLYNEVLKEVIMKSSIFWDTMACSPLKVNRCFGETCLLHLQG
jgi:hypothetical protein